MTYIPQSPHGIRLKLPFTGHPQVLLGFCSFPVLLPPPLMVKNPPKLTSYSGKAKLLAQTHETLSAQPCLSEVFPAYLTTVSLCPHGCMSPSFPCYKSWLKFHLLSETFPDHSPAFKTVNPACPRTLINFLCSTFPPFSHSICHFPVCYVINLLVFTVSLLLLEREFRESRNLCLICH